MDRLKFKVHWSRALANPDHVATLKQGVKMWNQWRLRNSEVKPDLSGAYISESSMDWAIECLGPPLFENADLSDIDLGDAR